jgi:hypothetical protein
VDRQQRRERAAELLAEVSALPTDAATSRKLLDIGAPTGDPLPEELRAGVNAIYRRQKAASEQLLLMAIREPSPKVRQLARSLEKVLSSSVTSVSMSLSSRAVPEVAPMLADSIARGEQKHRKALALLDELVEVL